MLQKVVSEVKALIKEVKQEGRDPNAIDLTSNDVAQKLQKRRSNLGAIKIDDSGPSADNLLSAMNQLAWERDLDLEKKMVPLHEEMDLEGHEPKAKPVGRTAFLSKKGSRDNSAEGSKLNQNANNKNSGKVPSQKPQNPKVEAMQMKDLHDARFGSPGGGSPGGGSPGGFRRGARVSPESMDGKPPSGGKRKGAAKKGLAPNVSSRPPSTRSSSGGSKESKDSGVALTDDKKRTNLAISGSRSSLNSASSLTSLLHAWDAKEKDDRRSSGGDHTDF